jgi:hypothetical protein
MKTKPSKGQRREYGRIFRAIDRYYDKLGQLGVELTEAEKVTLKRLEYQAKDLRAKYEFD